MPAYLKTSVELLDVPDLTTFNPQLPFAIDAASLAFKLGIRTRTLWMLVLNKMDYYKVHAIPKKSGGMRVIHAPHERIKYVQTKVLDRILNKLPYPEHVGAYVPGKTTRDTAEVHAGRPVLIVIDLKDFFPSTRRGWVKHFFNHRLGYPHQVASLLADLATVEIKTQVGPKHVIPQGAPTSGAICNWIAFYRLDEPILAICEKYGMRYTRYADDLAFSHGEKLDRTTTDAFIQEVSAVIRASGYRINRKKLRVVRAGRQQRLLGMTINDRPNIIRQHARNLRARIHHCKLRGFDTVAAEMGISSGKVLQQQIKGMLSYYHMINPQRSAQLEAQLNAAIAAHTPVE